MSENGDDTSGGDAAEMIACEDCGTLVAEMSMTMHQAVRCPANNTARPNPTISTANDNAVLITSSSNIHHDNNKNNDVIDLSSPPPAAATVASRKRSDQELSRPPRRRQRRGEGRLKRDADYDSDDHNNDNDDVEMMEEGSDDDTTAPQQQQQQQQQQNAAPEVVDLLEDDCDEEDEWSCPACTLFNDQTASRCDACGAPNPMASSSPAVLVDGVRAADPVRRERLIGDDDNDIDFSYRHYDASFHDQRDARRRISGYNSNSAGSPLSVMGGGAILGGIMGAAGNYMRGRPIGEGALRGATAGAMGGVMVSELLRSPDQSSAGGSPLSQARSAGANGLPAYPTMGDSSSQSHNTGNGATRRSSRQPRQSFRVSQQQSPDGLTTTTVVQSSGRGGSTRIVRRSQRGLEQQAARGDPMMAYMMHSMMAEGGMRGATSMGRHNNNDVDNMSYDQLLQAFGDGTENLGASVNVISSLPTSRVYITEDGKVDLPPDACECSVCLETFEGNDMRKTLPCLHGFHEACIDKWLHTNGVCPVCKFPVDQRRQQQQHDY